jgi:hypothetical protein
MILLLQRVIGIISKLINHLILRVSHMPYWWWRTAVYFVTFNRLFGALRDCSIKHQPIESSLWFLTVVCTIIMEYELHWIKDETNSLINDYPCMYWSIKGLTSNLHYETRPRFSKEKLTLSQLPLSFIFIVLSLSVESSCGKPFHVIFSIT